MSFTKVAQAVVLSAVQAIGAGCGDGDGGEADADNGVAGPHLSGKPKGEPACELLTHAEISGAIGEHDGGQTDIAYGGCVWTGTTPLEAGFTEQVSISVVPENRYRRLAEIGDPIAGFGEGATYAPGHGELWFRCGADWCGVKVTAAGEIEEIATRLAHSLDGRRQ